MQFPESNIAYIRVFGELFGGKYEGHVVPHKAIQREIAYCPGIEFIVFDIECIVHAAEDEKKLSNTEEEAEAEDVEVVKQSSFSLSPLQVIQACQACSGDILALEVLHEGSLDEMLALNAVFRTTIPNLFGLAPSTTHFESEGFVLKPKSQVFYKPDGSRIMLKHKNPSFTERKDSKAAKVPQQAQQTPATAALSPELLSEDEVLILEEMKQFINENRINAVLSKLDGTVRSNRKRVLHLISSDALQDIKFELAGISRFSKKEMVRMSKHLSAYTEQYCDFHKIDFTS
jgi:Rnl2 family RNA ligase